MELSLRGSVSLDYLMSPDNCPNLAFRWPEFSPHESHDRGDSCLQRCLFRARNCGRPPSMWREHIWSRTAGLSAVLWLELSRCGLSTEEPQFSDLGVRRKKKTAPPQPENVLLGPNSLEKLQGLWDEGVLGF